MWTLLSIACSAAPSAPSAPVPVDPRAAARATEVRVLAETASAAWADGRRLDAARAVLLGRGLDPAPFDAIWAQVIACDDPDVLALVASHRGTDPALAGELATRAARARIAARYADEVEDWKGVDLRRGKAVVDGVIAEYVVRPEPERLAAAVQARMALLWEVRDRFPRWERLPTGATALAQIEDAVTAGLPAPVAVGEGVEAALAALDPYTQPVWPEQIAAWSAHHAGVQVGIGVDVVDGPQGPVITLPWVGGPAWTGGVHAGDRIVAVDGKAMATAAAARAALVGPPGSKVKLAVERGAVSLVRAEVPEETVRGWARAADGWDPLVEDGVVFVHISAFRPDTDEAFDAVLGERAARVVVLDLRGNGGGDVMAAVNVADRFVKDGVLGDLTGRTLPKTMSGPHGELPWNAAVPGHALEGVPVVVLVDGRTASAAEIVAGALRERAKAVIVGEETFGKGLSQALRVDDKLGVGWQVTNATWSLPSGRVVEEPGGKHVGLVPDRLVVVTPGEQLQCDAFTRRRELPRVHPDGTPVPDLGTVARADLAPLAEDPQLAEALRIARELAP